MGRVCAKVRRFSFLRQATFSLKLTRFFRFARAETWEPLIAELLNETSSIDEIWALDSINHGESGALNATALGDNCPPSLSSRSNVPTH